MPFGKKSGNLAGSLVEIDFDEIWDQLIRPATPSSWSPIRIDEVSEPGSIPRQFLNYLREADAAVFDLTFANPNVYYELGVRHQVRPERTVLIAATGTTFAFNVGHFRVLEYDFYNKSTWSDFQSKLRDSIQSLPVEQLETVDNAKTFAGLPGWSAGPAERMSRQLARAANAEQLIGIWQDWRRADTLATDPLLELGRLFVSHGREELAVEVLKRAYDLAPDEYEVARTYAWYLRKVGELEEAEKIFRVAIGLNEGDVESLGMLGGLYKRRGEYHDAREMYGRAHRIDPESIYILLNLGAVVAIDDPDQDLPKRYYREVIRLVEPRLARDPDDTWLLLAAGEAHLALGDIAQCLRYYRGATEHGASVSALRSAAEQLELLMSHGFQEALCAEVLLRVLNPKLDVSPREGESTEVELTVTSSAKSLTIIHLSDLHFGYKTTSEGVAVDMHRFGDGLHNQPLWKHIAAQIDEIVVEGRPPEGVILVVSGDIAYEAGANEYSKSLEFFKQIQSETGIPRRNLIIVPGNHDVNWTAAAVDRSQRFDDYLTLLLDVYGEEEGGGDLRSKHPYLNWDFKVNTPRPDPSDILGIHHFPELNLFVAGFNSCVYEDQQHHFGIVGRRQIERVNEALSNVAEDAIRIAVLHHHVVPMDVTLAASRTAGPQDVDFDTSLVRDFGVVEEHLYRMKFDVVLHGHKHAPALRETFLRTRDRINEDERRIYVCGAGSTGVHSSELPQNLGNHFQILRFRSLGRHPGKPFVEVEWRVLDYTDTATWRSEGSWELSG